jgi:hypothetical protein
MNKVASWGRLLDSCVLGAVVLECCCGAAEVLECCVGCWVAVRLDAVLLEVLTFAKSLTLEQNHSIDT